jgi:hypothetical protein
MTYHLTSVAKHRHAKRAYEGLRLGTSRISLNSRFAARFDGVRRVRLSYDPQARTICLMPAPTQEGPAGPDIYRISRDARGAGFIYCATLRAVLPAGRYQFVRQTREGYLCRYDPAKPAGKR